MGTLSPPEDLDIGDRLIFTLREYGDIGDDADSNRCGNGGDEFNPLAPEPKKSYKMN